jgi:hypothetical protein
MTVASVTQYLTSVQGKPKKVEDQLDRIIRGFLWGENKCAPINMDILCQDFSVGGKKLVCIKDRNKAINLKLLQKYLKFDPARPTCAPFLDPIIAKYVPASPIVSPECRI